MNHNRKNDGFSFGFVTASGKTINVSDKALSKAKELFTGDLKETDNNEERFKDESGVKEFDIEISNVEMVSDRTNIRNGAVFKTREFSEKTAASTNNLFEFKIASAISNLDEILSKKQQRFENIKKESNEFNRNTITTKSQNTGMLFPKEAIKNINNTEFSIGFRTTGGSLISISNEALSKAQQRFKNDIKEGNNESKIAFQGAKMLLPEEIVDKTNSHAQLKPCLEFEVTSSDSSSVSVKGSLTTKQFKNYLEDTNKFKEMCIISKPTSEPEFEVENIGFQTARGQCVNITKEALLKAETLFFEETFESFENSSLLTKSLQKRKVKDLDDDIASNKQVTCNQFKKLRFNNEFEIQKNICKDSINIEDKTVQAVSSITTKVLIANNNAYDLNNDIYNAKLNKKNNNADDNCLISNEIVESTVALLADEKDSDIPEQWLSPARDKENENVTNVPSSPVIGGQFIPKKRKSIGGRKKSINDLKNREIKSISSHNLNEPSNYCVNSDQCIKKTTKTSIEEEPTNKTNKWDTTVNNEFGDTQLMIDFINESANILGKRLEAALNQDKQISLKETLKARPTISKLYFHRKNNQNNRISWKEISKGNLPILCTYEELIERKLSPEILDITANNAIAYKFRCTDFYEQDIVQNNIEGIQLEDGAYLILDENGYAGITEIKRSFLASPGVNPSLVPAGWVKNHYRWIVWKLASMDRIKLGSVILPRALIPGRVMMELKYRYDREIDRSERSALKKILEKDDVASKRMVLCVSSIFEYNDSATINKSSNRLKVLSKRLMLTDGWYNIQASIDEAMIKNIISDKIKEGTKLMTYGSELLNCDKGYPPLEVPENICLKIHTNSTRRARWDTKLGYVTPTGPMCIKLGSICLDGGLIGKIKVLIARVYPILYHEKTVGGESIFRNARCEEKANAFHEKECRSLIEAFYAKAEKYFSTERRKSISDPDSIDLAAIEWNENYDKLSKEEFMSKQEHERLINKCRMKEEKFRQKLESRLQESLPPPRKVTSVLKIRIVEEEVNAVLSIWSPSEEIVDILKEGNFISICNVISLGKRGNELQLTANRNAIFRRINVSNAFYPRRTYTALSDINKLTFAPDYGEFDTVGIIASIGNEPYGMKNFQAVYLAYPDTNSQSSYLSVLFWHGVSSHGYAEILTVGSPIACNNLEWRRATSWNIPMAYCTERSIFTRNPRQNHLRQPFEDLKHLITDIGAYVTICAAEISEEIKKKSMTRMSDSYRPDKVPANNSINPDKQIEHCTFEELTRKKLLSNQVIRSPAIQKRLEKLQYYGEAPSLSPIILKNSSKRVSLDYKSPLRSSEANEAKAHVSLNSKFSQNLR